MINLPHSARLSKQYSLEIPTFDISDYYLGGEPLNFCWDMWRIGVFQRIFWLSHPIEHFVGFGNGEGMGKAHTH